MKSSEQNVNEQKMSREYDSFTGAVELASDFSVDLQDLDIKVNSMMEKTPGKNIHGQPLYRCVVCGKEAKNGHLKIHIEANHLEGVSIQCSLCHHNSRTRETARVHMRQHTTKDH